MEIVWSSLAMQNWECTAQYIFDKFGKATLQTFLNESLLWQQQLSANPHLGHLEPLLRKRKQEYYSLVVHKNNKVIYYLSNDTIFIADYWDTRREPKTLTKEI